MDTHARENIRGEVSGEGNRKLREWLGDKGGQQTRYETLAQGEKNINTACNGRGLGPRGGKGPRNLLEGGEGAGGE